MTEITTTTDSGTRAVVLAASWAVRLGWILWLLTWTLSILYVVVRPLCHPVTGLAIVYSFRAWTCLTPVMFAAWMVLDGRAQRRAIIGTMLSFGALVLSWLVSSA
ncbi:MAG: hypothetical protein HUU29_06710 [Planctomycetaceae bacterium]|nr:hypothetical protein [Planctomycetaceae bacterium]